MLGDWRRLLLFSRLNKFHFYVYWIYANFRCMPKYIDQKCQLDLFLTTRHWYSLSFVFFPTWSFFFFCLWKRMRNTFIRFLFFLHFIISCTTYFATNTFLLLCYLWISSIFVVFDLWYFYFILSSVCLFSCLSTLSSQSLLFLTDSISVLLLFFFFLFAIWL